MSSRPVRAARRADRYRRLQPDQRWPWCSTSGSSANAADRKRGADRVERLAADRDAGSRFSSRPLRLQDALHAHVADLMALRLHLCCYNPQRPLLSLQSDHPLASPAVCPSSIESSPLQRKRISVRRIFQAGFFNIGVMGGKLFCEGRYDRPGCGRGDRSMDYFAGLDISMDETHVCVVDREGVVVRESKIRRRQTRSPANWPKRRVVVTSCSRLGGWRRSCFTG